MNLFEMNKRFSNTGDALPKSNKGLTSEEAEDIDRQKQLRRELGLPITKDLVYYYPPYTKNSRPVSVISFEAKHFRNDAGTEFEWFDVNVEVMGSDDIRKIHGDFFAEMQKVNFISLVENEESQNI